MTDLNLDNDTSVYFIEKIKKIDNPLILELNVNKGGSTSIFLKYINNHGGKL